MLEKPIPHAEGSLVDPEQHAVKELDRRVHDDWRGLRVIWSIHGQARLFLLTPKATCPFSYRRCTCRKCEWVVGRKPPYPANMVRFYQPRHPEEVTSQFPHP